MIVSELCSNGDLFDYVRNVPPPKLTKVVSPLARDSRSYLTFIKAQPHA
jgi:hypothetical protein